MTATITWAIEWMQTTPVSANPSLCVIAAGWRCTGTQQSGGRTYTGTVYSTTTFEGPGDPYTPYADLTQDQVLGWCWAAGVDKASAEAAVQSNIDLQINPVIIQPPLPWSQNAA